MSVHPFPHRVVEAQLIEPYWQEDRDSRPVLRPRPLTALEQMYAYWGQDRD